MQGTVCSMTECSSSGFSTWGQQEFRMELGSPGFYLNLKSSFLLCITGLLCPTEGHFLACVACFVCNVVPTEPSGLGLAAAEGR